jgi:peroxiredoxin
MKSAFIATVLLATSSLFYSAKAQNIQSIEVGTQLPNIDVSLKSTDGKDMSLKDAMGGEGLLVLFSCNTCPYVIKSQERTKEMMNYASERGIGMIIINSNEAQREKEDSYEAMKKYAKGQGYKVPYVVDENSKVADAFGATRTPEVFLFDNKGVLIYKGAMEDNPHAPAESKSLYLKSAIDDMLLGNAINPNSTKSIGCTIKRAS